MVLVNIYGLDQFLVGELSQKMSKDFAKIYEMDEDEIHFVACDNMVFHQGEEQTSWRVFVTVNAPKKVEVLQEQAAAILSHYIKEVAIHVEILFQYYSVDHYVKNLNDEYPLFLEAKNTVNLEYEDSEDLEEGEEEDQIYTEDIFKDLN